MYNSFDNDIIINNNYPLWIKLILRIITISSITTTTIFIMFVSQFTPLIKNISNEAEELLNDIDIDDLNLTTQRLIKLLDIICEKINC